MQTNTYLLPCSCRLPIKAFLFSQVCVWLPLTNVTYNKGPVGPALSKHTHTPGPECQQGKLSSATEARHKVCFTLCYTPHTQLMYKDTGVKDTLQENSVKMPRSHADLRSSGSVGRGNKQKWSLIQGGLITVRGKHTQKTVYGFERHTGKVIRKV